MHAVRIFALALSLAASAGCNEVPAPVKAARAFAGAAQGGNVKRMLELVDSRTVEYLDQAAERASDQIGGRRSVDAEEMLQIVDVDQRFMVAKAELLEETEGQARVRLTGVDGTEHILELVLEEEHWRVRVPLPAAPTPS